jgi:hypothetical protein
MSFTDGMRNCAGVVIAALMLAACSTPSHPVVLPRTSPPPALLTVSTAPAAASGSPRITKVLTVVEENHGQTDAFSGMPYLASMARTYGRTTAYRTLTHPSLPNYLAMAGGSSFGIRDDSSPPSHALAGRSVFDAAIASGHTARTYAEGMPSVCARSPHGRYAVKHNPWAYFSDAASQQACRTGDVPAGTVTAGALHNDIARGTLPNVGLLVPDLCHDAHDCSLQTADSWLKGWLGKVLNGPDYRAGRLAVVVTFDEDEGAGPGSILTVVIAQKLLHRTVTASLNHLSWSRWMTDLVGAAPLRQAARAPSLGRAFGL